MDNTEYFISPFRTVDFISIYHTINILGNFFFDEKLITDNDRSKPISLVNTLCEYLDRNNNTENATIALGKKLLHGTHFYGSNDNETLHTKYVDAELDNFIASLVFSKFGNTFGYLSAIVNGTNNLTLSFVKRKIEKDLSTQTFLNQDYTLSRLTRFSVKRIMKKLIFSLFPELEENSQLRIVDVDYIYAQAGLMFARSAQVNSENSSFEEYISIAQSIEQGVRFGHLNNSALQIFQLPAVLYYTHKNREMFKEVKYDVIINDDNFWNSAFFVLFSDLNTEQKSISSAQENHPVYLLEQALFEYKNRTEYAEYIIQHKCPLADESEYETEVERYKNNPDDYYCKKDNFHLPDINVVFSQQNEFISNLYANVEKEIVREAVSDELIEFIEQPNVTVSPIQMQFNSKCGKECTFFKPNVHEDSVLFEISDGTNPVAYALIRINNSITLHSSKNGTESFLKKIGLHSNTMFTLPSTHVPLKVNNQTFETFLTNLVEPKRQAFYNRLQHHGYESTTKESVIGFLMNLIPFYTCVQTAKTETAATAVCACIVDSLVLIPLFGQAANTGLKVFNASLKALLVGFQSSLKAFTIGQLIGITLRNFAAQTATEFSKLLTKEFFKGIGVSVLRTLDPGIELSYTLGKNGVKAVLKCFHLIARKVTSLNKVIKSINSIKVTVASKVGNIEGHSVFVNSITGKDGYGVKYFKLQETNVELRQVRGYRNEIPVVLVNNADEGNRIYQIIDIETGELSSTRWEVGPFDILEVETKPLREILKIVAIEGLSGRGRLINPRIRLKKQMMETRENIIREWSNRIQEDFISTVLRQYVLEDDSLRNNLLAHFAAHGSLPNWIQYYKLTNVNDYEILRYNSYVEDVLLTEEEAVERAIALFKNKYRSEFTPINPYEMYEMYQLYRLHSYINFDDFCSLGHYITNGHAKSLLQSPEGWLIQSAFNKIAMRFIDFPAYNVPVSYFSRVQATPNVFDTFKPGEPRQFHNLLDVESNPSGIIEGIKTIVPDGVSVQVLLEVIVDNPYMIVDLEKILPNVKTAVLLPNFEFMVERVYYYHYVEGNLIYKVVLKNSPISKSKLIATLNKNIETLDEQTRMHNTIIDDFDNNLLN